MKTLTENQITMLYQYLKHSIDRRDILLQTLFETGARSGECLRLTPKALTKDVLTIPPLKGSKLRNVNISTNLTAKLRTITAKNYGYYAFDLVVPRSQYKALQRYFYSLTERLFNAKITLHALRHTAFSRLYSETRDLLLVQQWAGHGSITSTMKYMHHELNEEANTAMSKILTGTD